MTNTGNFDFSRAVREWCFVQLPLFELAKLHDRARARGLSDLGLFSREPWEVLDREEIFVPVAYALHGFWEHDVIGCLEDGDLAVRDEGGYRPWAELLDEADERHGGRGAVQILYHHWQILHLHELQRFLTPQVPWGNLGDGLETFFEARARISAAPDEVPLEALRSLSLRHRQLGLLLVRVQNVFFPQHASDPRRSTWKSGPIAGLTDDAYEWTINQLGNTDYRTLADDCGVDAEALKQFYEQLVHVGLSLDPTEDLIPLLDQVRRSRRERLQDAARLALDYYDAARILRSWHQRVGGDLLPDIDEYLGINGTAFKLRHYGTLDTRGNCAVLPQVLEDFGLYPWRVQLIGEGDSEVAALRVIIEEGYGLSFEELGIAVTDMGGADIPAKAERLLSAFRSYANYFLLVFDNEGTAQELIEELRRSKVIEGVSDYQRAAVLSEAVKASRQIGDPDARAEALESARERASRLEEEPGAAPEFILWRENLEADNYSISEMWQVIERHAREHCEISHLGIEAAEVEELVKTATDREKGIASRLLDLARERDEKFVLSKPDFARLLARYALGHPERDGRTRKLLDLAEHLVRLTWSDRRLAGRLRAD